MRVIVVVVVVVIFISCRIKSVFITYVTLLLFKLTVLRLKNLSGSETHLEKVFNLHYSVEGELTHYPYLGSHT